MKLCSTCKQPNKKFHKDASNPDGLQYQCADCRKTADALRYENNKERILAQNQLNRQRARTFVQGYLLAHPCIDCGEPDPLFLEFDHRVPADKLFNIANMVHSGYSVKKITQEIAKCDIRCVKCHRKKTAKDFEWYKDNVV